MLKNHKKAILNPIKICLRKQKVKAPKLVGFILHIAWYSTVTESTFNLPT